MAYLRVANFWKYQNADVWKKSRVHPPWFKHYVHRDQDLDHLSIGARLLFWELVGAATRYSNVLEDDLNWLWAETRIAPETIREELPKLLHGGWLSQTQSRRRSREISRNNREDSLDQSRVDKEVEAEPPTEVSASSNRSDETQTQRASPNGLAALDTTEDIPLERSGPRFPCSECAQTFTNWEERQIHLDLDHALDKEHA